MGPSHDLEPQDADRIPEAPLFPERSLAAFTRTHFWEPVKKLEASLEEERLQKIEVERQDQLLRKKDPFHFVRRRNDPYAARFGTFKDLEKHIQMQWDGYNEAQQKLSEVNASSFKEAAALGHNWAKCWLDVVIRQQAASVIQACWRHWRKTGRLWPITKISKTMGRRMIRKVASAREARLLRKTSTTTEQTETRNRAMRRKFMSLDERQLPTLDERQLSTFEHEGHTDRHSPQTALLDDRPSPEPSHFASSGRIIPTPQRRAKGEAKASKAGRREDAETPTPGSPKKASKAASHSPELRSSVLQQLSKSMHMKEGETPMSGASSTSGDTPPSSPAYPLAAQQRAPRTSGSRLEDLLFSSGLCNSQPQQQQQQQQLQHHGQSRWSDGARFDNLLLDGRPTLTRLSSDPNLRMRGRSSQINSSNTHPVHINSSLSQSLGTNSSSNIGPGKPHNARLSTIDQNSVLPHMESGSSRPRRHSLTSKLVLSKSSVPARASASGRLTSPAAVPLSKSASFTSHVRDVQQLVPSGSSGNSSSIREGPLLSMRGGGGLKPTGTKPAAADGVPSRLGLLSFVQPGGH